MRIWLEKGKQKELFKRERELRKLSWEDFSKALNVAPSRLHSWVYEESLMLEEVFNKLRLKPEYKKFVIHKLEDNWGRVKGGKLSPGSTKNIKIPEKDEKLAEFWGILLGDGHVQKTQGYKLGTYNITVTGHAVLDKLYLLNFVKPLAENLFGVSARVYNAKTNQGLSVILDGRNIVNFFEKEGFKPGDKIRNQSTIPDWIKENPNFLAACLRGLHDTDGCFYRLTNQNSYQIGFTNHDNTLLRAAHEGLKSLGIGVSKIIHNRKYVITKKSEIAKFYKLIGFHNSKHLDKVNAYLKAP